MRIPLLVELCAGTAALSLRLERSKARPPVSRMGAKTGYADAILSRMGLHPGQGAEHYLLCEPDPGCRLLLEAYRDMALAQAAAEHIRSWKDEEPRALWERLREEGPAKCPPVDPREVARWLQVAAQSRIGTDTLPGGWFYAQSPAAQAWHGAGSCARMVAENGTDDRGWPLARSRAHPEVLTARLATLPTIPATITDDARTVDPREVARWCLTGAWSCSNPKSHSAGTGRYAGPGRTHRTGGTSSAISIQGLVARLEANTLPATITDDARTVDPREVARWVVRRGWSVKDSYFRGPHGMSSGKHERSALTIAGASTRLTTLPTLPATITDDARTVDPPQLPAGSWVYIDPPYIGTTGYGHNLGRPEVIALARRWHEAGAHVAVSEAEPVAELIADGWHAHELSRERVGQKRTFSKQQREVLTISRAPRGQLGLL